MAIEDRVDVAVPARPAAVRRPTRLLVLDGLRLLCALAVAGCHFGDSWRLDGVRPPAHLLPDAAPVLIYGDHLRTVRATVEDGYFLAWYPEQLDESSSNTTSLTLRLADGGTVEGLSARELMEAPRVK